VPQPRIARDLDEISDHAPREASEDRDDPATFVYKPPETLPNPQPRRGVTFGWIRAAVRGVADGANWATAMKDGWVPVMAADCPELSGLKDQYTESPYAKMGYIEHRGNVLCQIPTYKFKAREEYYLNLNRGAMAAIAAQAKVDANDPGLNVAAKVRTNYRPPS
jgi:hypothetical protein